MESPQIQTASKKRPRLVTSCDNCRLKKIKCLQPTPDSKCEACKAAKVPCRFRDREKYFAERSRAIAGPQSSYGGEQRSDGRGMSMDGYSASGVVSPEGDSGGRYQSYPVDPRRSQTLDSYSSRHAGSSSYSSVPSRMDSPAYSNSPPTYHRQTSASSLFSPEDPQYPNPALLSHLITVFFENMGSEFPFIIYEDISSEYWDQTLPAQLANAMAAMAARCSTHPELTSRGLHNVSEAYANCAKSLVAASHISNMHSLHASMLIAWMELKNNRLPSFRSYCQVVMKMSVDLGLSDQNAIEMLPSERERNRRRLTWQGILQLHMTASSVRQ